MDEPEFLYRITYITRVGEKRRPVTGNGWSGQFRTYGTYPAAKNALRQLRYLDGTDPRIEKVPNTGWEPVSD